MPGRLPIPMTAFGIEDPYSIRQAPPAVPNLTGRPAPRRLPKPSSHCPRTREQRQVPGTRTCNWPQQNRSTNLYPTEAAWAPYFLAPGS